MKAFGVGYNIVYDAKKNFGSTCRPRKSRVLNSSVKSLSLRIVTCRGEKSGISTSATHYFVAFELQWSSNRIVPVLSGVTYQRQPRQMPGGLRAPKGPNGPRRGPQRRAYKAACTHDNSWLFCRILWIHWRRDGSSSLLDTSSNCAPQKGLL